MTACVYGALTAAALAVAVPYAATAARELLHRHHVAPVFTSSSTPPSLVWRPIIVAIDLLDALTKSLTPPNQYLFRTHLAFMHNVQLHAAARLRIADLIHERGGAVSVGVMAYRVSPGCANAMAGPADCASVAARILRLLRACAAYGVFREESEGHFVNTAPSEFLRENHPDSLRSAILMFGDVQFRMMEQLPEAIVTGEASFQRVHGEEFWTWYGKHPDQHRIFDETMTQLGRMSGADGVIAEDFPWGSVLDTVVDVGGGYGDMLGTILSRHAALKGMIFDLPSVVERALPAWSGKVHGRSGIDAKRVSLVGGDVFNTSTLPSAARMLHERVARGDVDGPLCTHEVAGPIGYAMRDIVHDWPDEDVVRIFQSLRAAMRDAHSLCYDPSTNAFERRDAPPHARRMDKVVLVTRMVRPHVGFVESFGTNDADIVMLGAFGTTAGERTEEHFRRLLGAAGMALESVTATRSHYFILVATPAAA